MGNGGLEMNQRLWSGRPRWEMILPPSRGRGKKGPGISCPEALRAVRGWLEPWIVLMRYWKAFSRMPPPEELRVLFEKVFSGGALYLYVH